MRAGISGVATTFVCLSKPFADKRKGKGLGVAVDGTPAGPRLSIRHVPTRLHPLARRGIITLALAATERPHPRLGVVDRHVADLLPGDLDVEDVVGVVGHDVVMRAAPSRRRDYHVDDNPGLSLLKHLLNIQGGAIK